MDEKQELFSKPLIGLMSGTSCDGLDIAACSFYEEGTNFFFKLHDAVTVQYSDSFRNRLRGSTSLNGRELRILDIDFAIFSAKAILEFSSERGIKPAMISSHGHTVFHVPSEGYTMQIGCGATIASLTGITTICDFRQADIALGGQGAPLVPIGDYFLFNQYSKCLNLGGFANISVHGGEKNIAFDICPLNIVLNGLAESMGFQFDRGGRAASEGIVIQSMLDLLNELPFYDLHAPKSLGLEWVIEFINPIVRKYEKSYEINHLMRTFVEHFAIQISKILNQTPGKTLATGGGVYNDFLISRIQHHCFLPLEIPDKKLIDFKEAIIFSFLGYLRANQRKNVLRNCTGARRDSVSGALYQGVDSE